MRKYAFRKCKQIDNFSQNIPIQYNLTKELSTKRLESLSSELSTLKKESYLEFGDSGIRFYLMDKCKYKLRILLIGASGTPYENGSFFFDIYIPPEYKNKPPIINLINCPQSVLLNFNIYGQGQVCLSLLESYKGEPIDDSERWDKHTSSIDQLITIIQSSIFNEQPYFNEQGNYRIYGTEEGNKKSEQANISYTLVTMKYMILQTLKNKDKYKEFTQVINDHYKLKKEEIIKTCSEWCKKSNNNSEHIDVFNNIKYELNKI
jgi:ubiquitin-protein ligase